MRYWEIINETQSPAAAAVAKRERLSRAQQRRSDASRRYQQSMQEISGTQHNAQMKRQQASQRYQSAIRAASSLEREANAK